MPKTSAQDTSERLEPTTPVGFLEAQRLRFAPQSGYNLVGPDFFDPPGEDLYVLAHYGTREEAEAARTTLRDGGAGVVVVGPEAP